MQLFRRRSKAPLERVERAVADLAAALPPTAGWVRARRRRRGWLWFALGTAGGVGFGVIAGLIAGPGNVAGGEVGAALRRLIGRRPAAAAAGAGGGATVSARGAGQRARQAFLHGVQAARRSAARAEAARLAATQRARATTVEAEPPRLTGFKARLHEAAEEARAAAAETEAAMRRRYLEATKRL
ncbi:MAG: hypothetical protein U0531_13735 [Dehalococcoidia bacterium]